MLNSIIAFCLSRRTIVVFGLLLFAGGGYVAFQKLDIEAYPNPTPVILEITAQAPGLSAGEMERYYTIPIENGLYTVPGIEVMRSTSFYGLSFVRVLFKYGVDYNSAYAQTAIALQQNVSLPGGISPNIQQNSGTGEILRYQVVGPTHFGLTNLRTVQDWIVRRRLLQVHGVVAINSWGGPTKEFEVEVDPRKLQKLRPQLAADPHGARQCQHQRRWTRDPHRPAVHQHPRHRSDRRRRRRRPDPGLQGGRHRECGADPAQAVCRCW